MYNRTRRSRDIEQAYADFNRVVSLMPPQESIQTFDEMLGRAMAWRATAKAAAYSDDRNTQKTGLGLQDKIQLEEPSNFMWAKNLGQGSCRYEWSNQRLSGFPTDSRRKRRQGGVTYGLNFNPDGTVKDALILGEVPAKSDYSEYTLKSVREWRLATPPVPNCRDNYVGVIEFSVY